MKQCCARNFSIDSQLIVNWCAEVVTCLLAIKCRIDACAIIIIVVLFLLRNFDPPIWYDTTINLFQVHKTEISEAEK